MDVLEGQVSEEKYPDLNEQQDIIMEDSRQDNCRDVAEDGEDKMKIHSLRWDIYTRQKQDLIKREFLVSVPHPKGGGRCLDLCEGSHHRGKDQYEAIRLRGFDYKLFEEEQGGGFQEVLDGYLYLKHTIQLWKGDWVKQMEKRIWRFVIRIVLVFMGGRNSQFVFLEGRSYENVLGEFY